MTQSVSKYVYTNSDRTEWLSWECSYKSQNVSYTNNIYYSYDENGNLIGIKEYHDDQLTTEDKDFVYDGNKVTHTQDRYHKGETTPYQIAYYTLIYK